MKQNIIKHLKKTVYFVSVAVVGTILGISLQFAKAWTAPPAGTAPGGNVAAPITTGGNQTKSGLLTVNGGLVSPFLEARSSGGTPFVDFSNDAISDFDARIILAGDDWLTISGASVAVNLTYDADNTGYYVDPAGSSQMGSVYTNNWFRSQGQTGLYFQDYAGGLNMIDGTWIRTYGVGNFYAYGESQATTVRANSNLCIGSDCRNAWPMPTCTWEGWGNGNIGNCESGLAVFCTGGKVSQITLMAGSCT